MMRFRLLLLLSLVGCPGETVLPPHIDSIEVNFRPAGSYVTIRGRDFLPSHAVKFGSTAATVTMVNTAQIVCKIPAVSGTQSVKVGDSNAVSYTVSASSAPSISSISPVAAQPGDVLTIQGKYLSSPQVHFGILFDGVVLSSSSTQIQVKVPVGAWTEPITVETSSGTSNGVTVMITTDAPYPPSSPGAQASHFLKEGSYTSLLIEVDYVQGRKPSQANLDLLVQRLNERCHKPDGIVCLVDDVIPAGPSQWSVASLQSTESSHRDHYSSTGTKVLYVLCVNGSYGELTLGTAYGATSFALFGDSLDEYGGEDRAIVHEAGHILGLVNLGTPMQSAHESSTSPGHDKSQNCVMYKSVQATTTQFCSKCVEDLQAAGGR